MEAKATVPEAYWKSPNLPATATQNDHLKETEKVALENDPELALLKKIELNPKVWQQLKNLLTLGFCDVTKKSEAYSLGARSLMMIHIKILCSVLEIVSRQYV